MEKLPTERVSSLRNALRLLNLFTMEEPELSLSELSGKLGLGNSTIYRLTFTLMQEGFLARDPVSKNFRLGSSILAKGTAILSQYDICKYSPDILRKLVQETGETAHLSTLTDNRVIYLQKIDAVNYVHLLSHAGKQNYIHCTSSGQAILAFQPEEVIKGVIEKGLPKLTEYTVTNPQKLKFLLSLIKKNGYAFSREEMHNGVSSIASPVFSQPGKASYSISIAGPSSRINQRSAPELAKIVKRAANELSEKIKNRNLCI
ncbi:IclR family transcriptional regulator [Cytobacillus oceanisediminis]|uniref:IclR family transcriptional regulator n=1 Tax=Cytobacillus oceanisediminis TaxID=665099 RepID=UPI0023D9F582|nr:IclR family transcriptional regulator [Cytobacillus oceanisediminis]MDF2039381.1 IclR family transcriptional regulator [Cytobacillus oceanisediminis]